MPALTRITTPLKALLPDLTDVPQSRQNVGAIVASVVVHLFLLLLFVMGAGLLPEVPVEFRKNAPQPLELVIALPGSPAEVITPEALKARVEREMIDSTGLAKSEEKPKDPLFESDQDMKAASQNAATPDAAPMPSMEGRKDLPFTNFTTQDVILGNPGSAPGPSTPPARPRFEPRASIQRVQPKPLMEPRSEPPPEEMKKDELPEVVKPDETQIVLSEKRSGPITRVTPPETKQRVKSTPAPSREKERQEMAKLETLPSPPEPDAQAETMPQPPSSSGFQPQQERTKIEGSISNRGPAAVAAVRTPMASYLKRVSDAIGSRWSFYIREKTDLVSTGQAKLSYSITKDGRIVRIRVLANTSNDAYALICERSISEAEIGPPPEEALAVMVDGRLETELTFTLYPGF
jgi:hypothetical protein